MYTDGLPSSKQLQRMVLTFAMDIAVKLPVVSGMIAKKVQGEVADMEQSLDKVRRGWTTDRPTDRPTD